MKSLKQFNTFNLDVKCKELLFLATEDDYARFQKISTNKILIGGGSDILLTDDYHGIVGITQNKGIEIDENSSHYIVTALAGTRWHELVTTMVNKGIGGSENLALIPGTCGAAPVQNIGAYGLEFNQLCDHINVIDKEGNNISISNEQCDFGYRTSNFKTKWKNNYIITSVSLKLSKSWQPLLDYAPLFSLKNKKNLTPKEVYDEVIRARKNKLPDPAVLGNAGSFFKNPIVSAEFFNKLFKQYPNIPFYKQDNERYKIPAGWLIDQCGLKGFCIGDAKVYEKQALVIVNKGQATPLDIVNLAKYIISSVKVKFEIDLEPEIRIYGSNGEISLGQL